MKSLVTAAILCGICFAQQASRAALQPVSIEPMPVIKVVLPDAPSQHKFWDRENRSQFAAVAALNVADFALTHVSLQNGGRELNPVTRILSGSTAGLAVNFVGETAGTVGLSYLFHKTGHHRLERITSLINIGTSGVAVTYSVTHQ